MHGQHTGGFRAAIGVRAGTGPVLVRSFETIRPFTDGDGRVGSALGFTARATEGAVPRVGLVPAGSRDRFADGPGVGWRARSRPLWRTRAGAPGGDLEDCTVDPVADS